MTNPQWKRCERRIAVLLGGQRIPVSGRGDAPDVRHEWLSIAVKHRASLPEWLIEALSQAEAAAADGQLPIAVLHANGTRYLDALVVVQLADFVSRFVDTNECNTP
jgi:hypothetical protein